MGALEAEDVRDTPAATDASPRARQIPESRHACVSAIVLAFLRHPAAARPVGPALRERYEPGPPWAVTRRCLRGGMLLRGDPSPEGATGQAGVQCWGQNQPGRPQCSPGPACVVRWGSSSRPRLGMSSAGPGCMSLVKTVLRG